MRERLLTLVAVASAAAFVGVYAVAVRNPHGMSLDREAFARLSGNAPAPYKVAGERTLRTIDVSTIAAVLLALAFLALVRRRAGRALAAAVIVLAPVASAELLKGALPTPAGRPSTFPSGHTAVAVSIGLALVLAVPPVLRVTAALVGAAYGAAIAFAVVVLGWHYPSDAIGSFFLCGFWFALVALPLRGAKPALSVSTKGAAVGVAVVAAALLAAAAIAARHPVAVSSVRSRPAVAAAAIAYGALSLALFAILAPLVGERLQQQRRRLQSAP
jgi:membrane-associated phospholipid phosphatase